jgi:type I restriction enzyme M protein
MKPRRLMPAALRNLRTIQAGRFTTLGDVAEIVEDTIDIGTDDERAVMRRLVEGQSIRAVEGLVIPGATERSWQIGERKSPDVYELRDEDIIVGLVRPERRNIGMLLDDGNGLDDVVGSPDGIAVVRPKPEMAEDFPIGWLFETLRSEPCRLQLWTESGGTSYGKLTLEHVRNVHLPVPRKAQRLASEERVREWADVSRALFAAWYRLGAPEDRVAIVNSPLIGLQEDDS